jgi:hypothetical protein
MKKWLLRQIKKIKILDLELNVQFVKRGYLKDMGWIESRKTKLPVDRFGNAIPWITFPSLAFLNDRVKEDMQVFEYGSGNSTLWFSQRVGKVISVEHDGEWYATMKDLVASHSNVDYLLRGRANDLYAETIKEVGDLFDIIVLDGRDRVKCCLNSVKYLKSDGIIIWDNSDRIKYLDGYTYLNAMGFKRLDFYGLGPINPNSWCTSIFYRDENCFGI